MARQLAWMLVLLFAATELGVLLPTRRYHPRPGARWLRAHHAEVHRRHIASLPLPPTSPADRAFVTAEDGSTRHVIWGTLRVDLRGSGAVVPPADRAADAIVSAVRGGRGWIFLTAEGDVLASETFTSPLRLRGRIACSSRSPEPSEGRLTARDGTRWWSSAGDRVEPVAHSEGALSLSFTTAERGAMVGSEGAVKYTRDGGRSWETVDLGAEAAWAVQGVREGLFVATTAGMMELDPAGHARRSERRFSSRIRAGLMQFGPAGDALGRLANAHLEAVGSLPQRHPRTCPRESPAEVWAAPWVTLAGVHPAARDGWGPPDYSLHVGASRRAFLGSELSLRSVQQRGAAGPIALSQTHPPGALTALGWRGEDDLGAYSGRIEVLLNEPVDTPYDLVGTTRAGVLWLSGIEGRDRHLTWNSSSGRRTLSLPESYRSVNSIALADGGFMLWVDASPREFDGVEVHSLSLFDRDGVVRSRRGVVFDPSLGRAVGLGLRGGRWGLAFVTSGPRPRLMIADLASGERSSLKALSEDLPGMCPGVASRWSSPFSLHVLRRHNGDFGHAGPSLSIAPGFDSPDGATALRVVYESLDTALCVRHIDALQTDIVLDGPHPSDDHTALEPGTGAVHLHTRRDRMEGYVDTGQRIVQLHGVFIPNPRIPPEFPPSPNPLGDL